MKTNLKGKKLVFPSLKMDKEQIRKLFGDKDAIRTEMLSLVLVLAIMMVYFILRPINISYKQAKANIVNLKNEENTLIEKKEKLNSLSVNLEDKKVFISEVEDILPKTPEIPEMVLSIEKMAKDNSLYMTNFLPVDKGLGEGAGQATKIIIGGSGVTSNKTDWNTIEIQFDLMGSYPSIAKFLKDLEKNIRPVDIKSIRITGGGELAYGVAQPLRFGITANIFYQPE